MSATHQRKPAIVAVDGDRTALGHLSATLQRRYERDYEIAFEATAGAALQRLSGMARVAVVLAAPSIDGMSGLELLARTKSLHPHAKRALLVSWGDWSDETTATMIRDGITSGDVDYYLLKPWKSPDERFHRAIAEFLDEWKRHDASVPHEVTLVADPWTARAHELRDLMTRNGIPHAFLARDSAEGVRVLADAELAAETRPVLVLRNGPVLVDPANEQLAAANGVSTTPPDALWDVVVVGAGPGGLAAAVYAASEGLDVLVVEREAIGGQAGSSALIRNYLGFPRGATGAELAQRAYQQAWVFGARFLLMRAVEGLEQGSGGFVLPLSGGGLLRGRAVVLATGVSYRRLDARSLRAFEGAGVFYGSSPSEAPRFAGGHVVVVGGGNSAGQAAMHLSRFAAQVTVVVRGPSLAASMSRYLIDEIDRAPNVDVRYATTVEEASGDDRLRTLVLRTPDGAVTVPADGLFVLIGASPHTSWLPEAVHRDEFGFVVTGADLVARGRWTLGRPPSSYETSLAGVFAVGDVRAGSVKRVASAVGEGSVVIQQVHRHLEEARSAAES